MTRTGEPLRSIYAVLYTMQLWPAAVTAWPDVSVPSLLCVPPPPPPLFLSLSCRHAGRRAAVRAHRSSLAGLHVSSSRTLDGPRGVGPIA